MAAPLASTSETPRRLGRYVLARELWTTAWFSLWSAADTQADAPPVSIKRVHGSLLATDEARLRLLDAARAGTTLRHPNVLAAREVLVDGGEIATVCEAVEGVPLREVLRAAASHGVAVPVGVAVRIALELLAALETAHGSAGEEEWADPITPLDLTPDNVLVTTAGAIKLLDVTLERAAVGLKSHLGDELLGYRAPERLDGPGDQRSDLFAVGILLWEMLAERTLFTGGNVAEALKKRTIPRLDEAGLRSAGPVPAKLATAIARSLTRASAGRFPSADHMGQALMSSGAAVASPEEVAALVQLVQRARALSGASLQQGAGGQTKKEEFRSTPVVGTVISPLARVSTKLAASPAVRPPAPAAKSPAPAPAKAPAVPGPGPVRPLTPSAPVFHTKTLKMQVVAPPEADDADAIAVSMDSEPPPAPPPPPKAAPPAPPAAKPAASAQAAPHAGRPVGRIPALSATTAAAPAPTPQPAPPAAIVVAPPAAPPAPASPTPTPTPPPPPVAAPHPASFDAAAPAPEAPAPFAPPVLDGVADPLLPEAPFPTPVGTTWSQPPPKARPLWQRPAVIAGALALSIVLWLIVLARRDRTPEPQAAAPTPTAARSVAPLPATPPPTRVADTPPTPPPGPGVTSDPPVQPAGAAPGDVTSPGDVTTPGGGGVQPRGSGAGPDAPPPAASETKPAPPRRRYNPKTI